MLAQMSWFYITAFSVVWLIVMLLLATALMRARQGAILGSTGSRHLLVYAGLVVPLIILVAFLIYSVSVGGRLRAEQYKTGALVIKLLGKQWWWDAHYRDGGRTVVRVANEIHIPVGRPVVFELETRDVIHSFWVPALAGKVDLIPGRTNYQWLQANRPGVYRGQCAEYCGIQHAHMGLEIVAESPARFAQWLEQQSRPALQPANERALRGQQVFLNGPCALCHSIRGTEARAEVGPDLTHVAARNWLAAATVPNTRGSLAGWIIDSQAIKPGNHMPQISMPAGDFQDLLAYMETLH